MYSLFWYSVSFDVWELNDDDDDDDDIKNYRVGTGKEENGRKDGGSEKT